MNKILVSIVMGSPSDLDKMENAADILKELGISHEVTIASAHRSPKRTEEFAVGAAPKGIEVIIAGAGGAAHLAGVIASHTSLPVIGVPIDSSALNGLDALLATAQMPSGVPVATMAIGAAGAKNAGIFAAQILGVKYPEIRKRLTAYKKDLAEGVARKAMEVERKYNQG